MYKVSSSPTMLRIRGSLPFYYENTMKLENNSANSRQYENISKHNS